MTTRNARISVTAWTTGKSRAEIAESIRSPTPPSEKTRSITRVPPTRKLTLTARTVTEGARALRSM